jgi:uncharacterized protein YfaT (DUF1175 family)
VWTNIITKYNSIPLVRKVNPDLTDYVTNQALNGVLKWWLSKKKTSEQTLAPELCFITKSFRFTRRYNFSSPKATWKLHKRNSSRLEV